MALAERCITDQPRPADFARFVPDSGPRFVVTIDTEEEFDWSAPHQRTGYGLDHVPAIARFQHFCEEYGVVPLWLIDYPIATCERAVDILREPVREGRAEIGLHLHPWVNPPFVEEVNEFNSYAGNLEPGLEHEKLARLHEAIVRAFGIAPLCYRAGRYGIGAGTLSALRDCGVAIDSSVRSRFDYSATGGGNFRDLPLEPWWPDDERRVLELPLTTVFRGRLRRLGDWIYPRMWREPRMRGVLSRTGLLERIPLTPEGVTAREAIRGIDVALDDGVPVLVFSFHSPSLDPGHTTYVRSEEDLDAFYDWWREIFAHLARRGVAPTSTQAIMDSLVLA